MVAGFPRPDQRFDNEAVADEMGVVIDVITALRNIRGEMNVPPGEQILCILRTKNKENEQRLRKNQSFIQNLARVKDVMIGDGIEKPTYSAFAVVRDIEILVPMERSRMEEEAKRLQKEIVKIEKDIAFVGKKLSNEQFLAKAPADVVQEEKAKASEYRTRREKLEENLRKIEESLSRQVHPGVA
jgi:valyl-tRNA synthetase